jgi:hypothetical protein
MPLIATGADPAVVPEGVSFPMTTPAGDRILVIVTPECLHSIDRSKVPDQFGGADTFSRNRALIEGAASAKVDAEGAIPAEGMRDGLIFVDEDGWRREAEAKEHTRDGDR